MQLDPHLDVSKRVVTNREKSRFCGPFVSLVSHPLTSLPPSEIETLIRDELPQPFSMTTDPWHQFASQIKDQFMAMTIYLIPLSEMQLIVSADFPGLRELVNRSFVRLDTSDLDGAEDIVYCEEEADRYIDCWRRFAGKYASCGL
jgi:hypothetical protein